MSSNKIAEALEQLLYRTEKTWDKTDTETIRSAISELRGKEIKKEELLTTIKTRLKISDLLSEIERLKKEINKLKETP